MAKIARRRHARHSRFARLRKASRLVDWFAERVTTLTGTGATSAFTAAVSDVCTSAGHGLETGDGPLVLTNSGGALPAGLSEDPARYWANVIDVNTFYLHESREGARKDLGRVDITDTGSGTHSFAFAAESNQDIHARTLQGDRSETIASVSDIDSL